MKAAIRTNAMAVSVLVLAGAVGNLLVLPAFAHGDIGGAYARLPLPAALASVIYTTGWVIIAVLIALAGRALIERTHETVTDSRARRTLVSATILGLSGVIAGLFVIPSAATTLAFSRIAGDDLVNPVTVVLVTAAPIMLVLCAFLGATGCAIQWRAMRNRAGKAAA